MTPNNWWTRSRSWSIPAQLTFAIALILVAALIIGAVTDSGSSDQSGATSSPTIPSPTTDPSLTTTSLPTTTNATSPNTTSAPPSSSATTTTTPPGRLPTLTITEPTHTDTYDRDLFGGGWIDVDRDCRDTRAEVLLTESRTPANLDGCRVTTGNWTDPWSETVTTEAADLDVDHTVPLANAWRSGAWAWTPARRIRYANYLTDPAHLIAIPAGENRSKGDDGPEDWRPPDPSSWCRYALVWARIKDRWSLTANPAEWGALTEMAATC